MFYKLKSKYALRGWEGMTGVLLKRPSNQIQKLTLEQFQVLTLCDGETMLPSGLMNEVLENTLQQCIAKGWVESCEKPCPIETDQYYKYYRNRFVQSILWSVTGKCNFRCRHCYVEGPYGGLGELSTQQALDLIDQMAECGVLRVEITGGEPFLRHDFWHLIDRLCAHRIVVDQVYTNGWLLSDKILDEFEKRGMKPHMQISFDGVGWHDWMRGVAGAEKAALRAFQRLQERGYEANAAMCIHRGNLHTIPDTVNVLKKVGVKYLNIFGIDATDLWNSRHEGNALSLKEYVDGMIPYISWYYQMGCPIEHLSLGGVIELYRDRPYQINISRYNGTEETLERYLCGTARWTSYVTSEGRLLPCMPMAASSQRNKFPLVQEIGLQKGLSDSYYMQFVNKRIKDLLAVNQECAACEYCYKCGGGCRATALAEENNIMGCDREKCMLHRNGYEKRIRQAADGAIAKYDVSFEMHGDSEVST